MLKKNYPHMNDNEISEEISGIIKVQESFDHMADEILAEKNISAIYKSLL